MNEEIELWDKRFGATCYNRAWELLDKQPRSADEDADLLASAFAQRFHWFRVGEAKEKAIAEWQVSRAAAALGYGDLAVAFAERSLAIGGALTKPDFLRASLSEGAARAYAAAGDAAARDAWLGKARAALDDVAEEEDRAEIAAQIDSVP